VPSSLFWLDLQIWSTYLIVEIRHRHAGGFLLGLNIVSDTPVQSNSLVHSQSHLLSAVVKAGYL
jgi:hypothetical protein